MKIIKLQLDEADLNQIIRALYDYSESLADRAHRDFPQEEIASVLAESTYADLLALRLSKEL